MRTCVGCIGRLVGSCVSSVFLHLPILKSYGRELLDGCANKYG